MSSAANLDLASWMLMRAALKVCSEGGMDAARFVFSVSRVMKNMKRPVLIWSSAKLALPAGMPVCFLQWTGSGAFGHITAGGLRDGLLMRL